MISSTFFSEALLACTFMVIFRILFSRVKLILFILCSRPHPPLSIEGAILVYLDFIPNHDLVIWNDGAIFFLFKKISTPFFLTAYFVALKSNISFQQALCVPIIMLKLCHSASCQLVLAAPTSLPILFSPFFSSPMLENFPTYSIFSFL